ncbi:hypothetical protein Tco_0312060 [Tanacetum coccineum]
MKTEKLWFTAAITSMLMRFDVKVQIKAVTKASKLQQAGTDGFMIIAAMVTDAINMISRSYVIVLSVSYYRINEDFVKRLRSTYTFPCIATPEAGVVQQKERVILSNVGETDERSANVFASTKIKPKSFLGGGSIVGKIRLSKVKSLTMSFHTTLKVDHPCDEPVSYRVYLESIIHLLHSLRDEPNPLDMSRKVLDQTITNLICEYDSPLHRAALSQSVTDEVHRLWKSQNQASGLFVKFKELEAGKAHLKAEKISSPMSSRSAKKNRVVSLEDKVASLQVEHVNMKASTDEALSKVSVVEAKKKELICLFPTFLRRLFVSYEFGN